MHHLLASRSGRCGGGHAAGVEAVRQQQEEMNMHRLALLMGLAVLATSCSKEASPPSPKAGAGERAVARAIVLKVDGMQRGAGGKT